MPPDSIWAEIQSKIKNNKEVGRRLGCGTLHASADPAVCINLTSSSLHSVVRCSWTLLPLYLLLQKQLVSELQTLTGRTQTCLQQLQQSRALAVQYEVGVGFACWVTVQHQITTHASTMWYPTAV
jgi:hypothetical protein